MVLSAKGVEVSIDAMRAQNPYATAVGNARMNARGDLLGMNGKIIKTREELALEYNTSMQDAVQNVPLSDVAVDTKKHDDKKNAQAAKKTSKIEEDSAELSKEDTQAPESKI